MKRAFILLVFTVATLSSFAQNTAPFRPANILSVGASFIGEKLPEGTVYYPLNILARIYLKHYSKKDGGLSIYAEPQFVPVFLAQSKDMAFEFGANLGLEYLVELSQNFFATAAIGSGPHYITVQTDIQSPGFIFSDNFELGVLFSPHQSATQFNVRARFRHISNAGIRNPNKGIDNWFFIFGASTTF